MKIALIVVSWLLITATVLPLVRKDAWWIRVLDFPRIQITVLTAIVLIAFWLVGSNTGFIDPLLLTGLTLSLLYQSYMMYPYTVLARKQVQQSENPQPDASISLLCSNVLMSNRDADRLKNTIRAANPDIVLTLETDAWWHAQLQELAQTYPYAVYQPQANFYGMMLFSRLELIDPQVAFLVQDDVPSIQAKVRLPSGQIVALHCLHPRPPHPDETQQSTERDAELLIVGRAVKPKEIPVIVLGDLNDVAWSRTNYLFQDISGLLDPRIGRGFYNTFHATYPWLRFPLDHFFHSNHFRLVTLKCLPSVGSDHFPVFIRLSYEPDAELAQPELQASAADQQEADEKIAKAT